MTPSRHLLLVGGGHAHALALTHLGRGLAANVRITLLSDGPTAVYSGMVPGVIEGRYRPAEAEIDLAALAARAGAGFSLGRAVGIDAGERVVLLEGGGRVRYDVASFDIGSTVAGLDLRGVHDLSLRTRPIAGLVAGVEREVGLARHHQGAYRLVVVGGGAGGVELAFTLRHRLVREGVSALVTLIHSGARILEGSPRGLRRRVRAAARKAGVRLQPESRVSEVTERSLYLTGAGEVEADAVVWAAGAAAHPLFRESGIASDAGGFVLTRDTLQLQHCDELFASGDCAALARHPGTPKAGVYAVRQAPLLAANLLAYLEGRSLRSYRPRVDFLTLLNLGGGLAVGSRNGISFGGRWVMALKDHIDRRFMRGLQP